MARTIFIGDVHGCLEELQALFAKLEPIEPGDVLVFVGDLVDKGPDSLGVLDYVRTLSSLYGVLVTAVSGNHEEKALRDIRRGIYKEPWMNEASLEQLGFMESMPLTWYDEALGVRVVHGGIFPALLEKHPDAFEKIEARGDKWRKGGGKAMNRARRMLRVRYVGQESGDMLALGENQEGDPFWADTYDGSQGFVIYGHSPWQDGKVKWNDHAAGIDTACVFGGKLTALVLEPDSTPCVRPGRQPTVGGIPYRLVSVDAERRHAEPMEDD